MDFSQALKQESRKTFTENGATAYSTTGDALLDLFGSIGALRGQDIFRIERLFTEAYNQCPLMTMKCVFYARDIRGGLGERATARILFHYAAKHYPEAMRDNIPLIGLYGRYDDLYVLQGTQLEDEMWAYMKKQLAEDEAAMAAGKACSLLAKWLKTPDASSKNTRQLGILTAKKLGLSVYVFKRKLRALRKYIGIVERMMSAKQWKEIKYANVPSRAMFLYRKAFEKNDGDRYRQFISAVEKGEQKIHAATLFPYDILEKYGANNGFRICANHEDPVLEAQWKALPDFTGNGASALVIADTSGSMWGRPLATSVGLAVYFAERNKGPFNGLWMSFSADSKVQRLKGATLAQKLSSIDQQHWGMNTNLEKAFSQILDIALRNGVKPEDMVKSLIVISDMQIDHTVGSWSFHDEMAKRYRDCGYELPNVVYWNVESRSDVFHADKSRKGVQLCSGQSPSVFKELMSAVGMTPSEMMFKVLTADRYAPVTIAKA